MPYALQIGEGFIADILNPSPRDIDLNAIERRLRVIHRFSNDPRALTVHQHRTLVRLMAEHAGMPAHVCLWAYHHDDHEAIIGDIPGPLKSLIGHHTNILKVIEGRLDEAICKARGIEVPDATIRSRVHGFDKAAETLEWCMVLGMPFAPWNVVPGVDDHTAKKLLDLAFRAA